MANMATTTISTISLDDVYAFLLLIGVDCKGNDKKSVCQTFEKKKQ